MDGLARLEAGGATDYMAVVREFIDAYSQRGLVMVISDFLDDQGCERALQYLADFGHELMLLQIWCGGGPHAAMDGRTGTARRRNRRRACKLDFDDEARRRYTHAFDEYAAAIENVAPAQRRPLRRRSPPRNRWKA